MKEKINWISILINVVMAFLLLFAVNYCRDNNDSAKEWKAAYKKQRDKADSLSSRAAIDCDQKIQKARNQTLENENRTDRPVKPGILR